MKSCPRSSDVRTRRSDPGRRDRVLAAFDRSGLSATAFARQHGINYTTFCGWRQRRTKAKTSPAFVQVELPTPAAPAELMIELGAQARLRIGAADQIALAADLIQAFNAKSSC